MLPSISELQPRRVSWNPNIANHPPQVFKKDSGSSLLIAGIPSPPHLINVLNDNVSHFQFSVSNTKSVIGRVSLSHDGVIHYLIEPVNVCFPSPHPSSYIPDDPSSKSCRVPRYSLRSRSKYLSHGTAHMDEKGGFGQLSPSKIPKIPWGSQYHISKAIHQAS